jgi:oligopeptide/dipeptide ABC transporter ATP-binding protein
MSSASAITSGLEHSFDHALLEVEGLKTYFFTKNGVVKAVDGVDFAVRSGEVLGLVGESGCGKSVTSYSIMGLVSRPGRVIEGSARFKDVDLLSLREAEIVRLRGDSISMIFQQPQASLDPVYKVGHQVAEALLIHTDLDKRSAWRRAVELLQMVGIPDAEYRAYAYPHELSGGMAQRVMIAIALACEPELLIADEPTTALDVTIQAQIIDLLRELRARMGMAIILITHDLGVIAEIADRVAVMYAGQIVEETGVATLFDEPLHPYTQGLMKSLPVLGKIKDRLEVIPGHVPDLIDLPAGCSFEPRCQARFKHQLAICAEARPNLEPVKSDHNVRRWLYHDNEAHAHRAPLAQRSTETL